MNPIKRVALLVSLFVAAGLIGFGLQFLPKTPQPTNYVGVMIDNHEDAREFQRGLEKAPLVEEQLVEGFITRFIAFLDVNDLPGSIGPVRSVRPYFIDGSAPIVSAIFHVGGSPEAIEQLDGADRPATFSAIRNDTSFDYDKTAYAPHDRFISSGSILKLLSTLPAELPVDLGFHFGKFIPEESASAIDINFYSPLHDISYTYSKDSDSYQKQTGGEIRLPSPKNILIFETDVEVIGPYGRLKVVMEGSGAALLFRDGGMQKASWSKSGFDQFFTFRDAAGESLQFKKGQIWMIVLDSLDRVSWK